MQNPLRLRYEKILLLTPDNFRGDYQGAEDIFELVVLDKPNVGLLSPAFLEDVANLDGKNLAVDLL